MSFYFAFMHSHAPDMGESLNFLMGILYARYLCPGPIAIKTNTPTTFISTVTAEPTVFLFCPPWCRVASPASPTGCDLIACKSTRIKLMSCGARSIRQLHQLCPFISDDRLRSLMVAFIHSRLDYGSFVMVESLAPPPIDFQCCRSTEVRTV